MADECALRDAIVAVLDALPPDLDRHADCDPPEDDIPGSGCDEHRLAVAVRRLRAILRDVATTEP